MGHFFVFDEYIQPLTLCDTKQFKNEWWEIGKIQPDIC